MSEFSLDQPPKRRPTTKEEFGALKKEYSPLRRRAEEILKEAKLKGKSLKRARRGVARELLERQRRSDIDHVTDLPVRRLFEERLREEAERSRRFGHPLTMVIVDLNGLKKINGEGGYPAGDKALRTIAEGLKGSKRELDFVARYGGDEFALLLVETPLQNVDTWWERFREKIKDKPYTVSAGATEVDPDNFVGTEQILSDAVFQAKEEGQHTSNHLIKHFPD
ncbi:MAG: GGDEF domain-containing protein [bacterium]|nr:GGDEF domain-containing protein [bacterium]